MQQKVTLVGPLGPSFSGIAQFQRHLLGALEGRVEVSAVDVALARGGADELSPESIVQLAAAHPATWVRVARRLREEAPALAVFSVWTPLLLPAYRGLLAALPPQTTALALVHSFVPHRAAAFQRWALARLAASFDAVVALEGTDAALVPDGATWLPHPVGERNSPVDQAAARRALGLDPARRLILFFGFVREYKGLDLLLEAFASLGRDDAGLLVAGQHLHRYARLDRALEQARSERLVVWDRVLSDEEMHLAFAAADVVALPYRMPVSSGVGTLALQHGRPVVVADFPALARLAAHHPASRTFPPVDVPALADALAACLDAAPEAIFPSAEAFSWEAFASRLLAAGGVSG